MFRPRARAPISRQSSPYQKRSGMRATRKSERDQTISETPHARRRRRAKLRAHKRRQVTEHSNNIASTYLLQSLQAHLEYLRSIQHRTILFQLDAQHDKKLQGEGTKRLVRFWLHWIGLHNYDLGRRKKRGELWVRASKKDFWLDWVHNG